MIDERAGIITAARRLVVKIGSRVLTGEDGNLDQQLITHLAEQIADIRRIGKEVVIVSSGAIAAGRQALGLSERPRTIPQKQAAAAVGQTRLMRSYEEAFARFGYTTGQLLLTREDLADRQRFLNARAALDAILEYGAIPIINENDTVIVDEIKFGDNDNLSALVTSLTEAQLLVILTDIDGFYNADPRNNPEAQLVPLVRTITREVELAAGGSGSTVGTGGMATKIAAAKKAGRSGVATVMINGKQRDIITHTLAGAAVGTLFLPPKKSLNRRKHWIAYTLRPSGKIIVDKGAREVLSRQGKSLLPSGIVAIEGKFGRGSSVRICDTAGVEFARGIVDYSQREVAMLAGRQSSEIEDILGYRYSDEIIHRDNLVIL